jgi:hypothetical protein
LFDIILSSKNCLTISIVEFAVCEAAPSCCNQQKRSSSFNNEINCSVISCYSSEVAVSEKNISVYEIPHTNSQFSGNVVALHETSGDFHCSRTWNFVNLHFHLNGTRPHREKTHSPRYLHHFVQIVETIGRNASFSLYQFL